MEATVLLALIGAAAFLYWMRVSATRVPDAIRFGQLDPIISIDLASRKIHLSSLTRSRQEIDFSQVNSLRPPYKQRGRRWVLEITTRDPAAPLHIVIGRERELKKCYAALTAAVANS